MENDKFKLYEKKRHFKVTPEPKPRVKVLSSKNRFVIHYHAASHLHFDLRLEVKGVLKSWAVPRGIPNRPETKKLAVQVEDHPLDYISFEGEIPKGEYGAGQVSIFDTGYFEPAHPEDIEQQLSKGHFSFFLFGKKLAIKLNLVRLRQSKNWLLLLADEESINPWINELGVKAQMPKKIEPMKAFLAKEPFDSPDWLFELKWDGIRAISYLNNGQLSILSRNFVEQIFRYPELADLSDFVLGSRAVLDGEIVAFNDEGLPSFQALQQRINLQSSKEIEHYRQKTPVTLFVFDVIYWQQRLLFDVPLIERRKILESIIIPHAHIQLSDYFENKGKPFFDAVKEKGLEGIVAKKINSFYKAKRSKDWLKIKAVNTQEFVIGGYTEPRGGRLKFGALLLGVYKDSQLIYVGHVGTGFSEKLLEDIYSRTSKIETPEPSFAVRPKTDRHVHWLAPVLVAEVKFSEWTEAGYLRHPSFVGLRNDIDPKEVKREIAM